AHPQRLRADGPDDGGHRDRHRLLPRRLLDLLRAPAFPPARLAVRRDCRTIRRGTTGRHLLTGPLPGAGRYLPGYLPGPSSVRYRSSVDTLWGIEEMIMKREAGLAACAAATEIVTID